MINKLSMMTGALILTAMAVVPSRSEASERVFVGVNVGQPTYYAPVVERQYVPGHYELRTETVVVEPEHHVREWIGHDRYRDVFVQARYETRQVQVWIPAYYQDVGVERTVVVHDRPHFSLGGFFRF